MAHSTLGDFVHLGWVSSCYIWRLAFPPFGSKMYDVMPRMVFLAVLSLYVWYQLPAYHHRDWDCSRSCLMFSSLCNAFYTSLLCVHTPLPENREYLTIYEKRYDNLVHLYDLGRAFKYRCQNVEFFAALYIPILGEHTLWECSFCKQTNDQVSAQGLVSQITNIHRLKGRIYAENFTKTDNFIKPELKQYLISANLYVGHVFLSRVTWWL